MPQLFLLSPANCGGKRARIVMSETASFDVAVRLKSREGAPIGDVFAFLSGLYFRGKLAYARAFARPPDATSPISGAGAFVITPTAGLRSIDTPVTLDALRAFANVDIAADNPRYRGPLETSARAIAQDIGAGLPASCSSAASPRRSTSTCCRRSSATASSFRSTSSAAAT